MAFKKITETDLAGLGVTGMPDVPGLNAADMQRKFDELPRYTAERLILLMDELAGALAAAGIGTEGGPLQQVLDELAAAVKAKADSTSVLGKEGTEPYEPTTPYSPATKKYVDDTLVAVGAGDMQKSIYDADGDGVVDDAEKLGGMPPEHFASVEAAMPKAGGTFTGNVVASNDSRTGYSLMNIAITEGTADGENCSSSRIIGVRK